MDVAKVRPAFSPKNTHCGGEDHGDDDASPGQLGTPGRSVLPLLALLPLLPLLSLLPVLGEGCSLTNGSPSWFVARARGSSRYVWHPCGSSVGSDERARHELSPLNQGNPRCPTRQPIEFGGCSSACPCASSVTGATGGTLGDELRWLSRLVGTRHTQIEPNLGRKCTSLHNLWVGQNPQGRMSPPARELDPLERTEMIRRRVACCTFSA
jgi:hypothetical protein